MHRARLNLALLVVAAGLGVGIFLAQKKEEKGPPLTALTSDLVTRIELAHPGMPAVQMDKGADGKWRFTAPIRAEVDEFEINALLGLASTEAKQGVSGGKLAELGLEPPGYTLKLNDTTIGFGGTEPLSFQRYVKVGDTVSLIEDPPGAALDKDYADLVAKDLVPTGSAIESIEVPKLTVRKTDKGWVATPGGANASTDALQKFVDGWTHARAMWNESAVGKDLKGDAVKLTLAGGEVRRFVVVPGDQLKLNRPDIGVTYVLSKALSDELLKLPEPKAEPAAKTDAPQS